MSESPPTTKMRAARFLPSLSDWGHGVAGGIAVIAGLAAMERAKARDAAHENDYFVFFAVALAVDVALVIAWSAARRWIAARKRSRPTV